MVVSVCLVQCYVYNGPNHSILDEELASQLQCRHVGQDVGNEVESRVCLEVVKHAKKVLDDGALSLALTEQMLLTRLHDRQVSQQHEGALNRAGKVRINLVDLGRTTFLGLLILDYLSGRADLVANVLLNILHQEVKDPTVDIQLDALLYAGLVLEQVDEDLEHASFMCQAKVLIRHESQHLLLEVETDEKLSILRCASISLDNLEGLADRIFIVKEQHDLLHLLDHFRRAGHELHFSCFLRPSYLRA